jgi:lipoprotein-anchoring transpeptidase ErfK/SrfK
MVPEIYYLLMMNLFRLAAAAPAIFLALFLTSCGSSPSSALDENEKAQKGPQVNPHPPESYPYFKWKNYPGTTRYWKSESLLAEATPSNTRVEIDVAKQRGFLIVDDEIAMDYRISTGRRGVYDTPPGEYRIIEKTKDKHSNLYGKILDAEGNVLKLDADTRVDEIPEGGSFLGSPMQYWMRLTNDGIGMHQGDVKLRYASHGCIRSHHAAVPIVFSKTQIGTPVTILPYEP